jgi:NADH-quinone oxidoreductase subunit M
MTTIGRHLLSVLLLVPVAGAIALLMVDRKREGAIRGIAAGVATLGMVVAIALAFRFEPFGAAWQFVERVELLRGIGAGYIVGLDGVSLLLVLTTTVLGAVAVWCSEPAMIGGAKEYYMLLLLLQAACVGVFVSLDAVLFIACWVWMLAAMYALTARCGGVEGRSLASRFAVHAAGGSLLVAAGILAIYVINHAATGVYTFDVTQFHRLSVARGAQRWIFASLLLGFVFSIPVFPLRWIAAFFADAPTAASVMMAAAVLKSGPYGLMRFSLPILPGAAHDFAPVVAVAAIAATVGGAAAVFARPDWAGAIGLWSVSQLGLIVLGLFGLTPAALSGSVFQQVNHAGVAGGLVLLVASITGGTSRLGRSGHMAARLTPMIAAAFLIFTLAAAGVPAFGGFVGQMLIVEGLFGVHPIWTIAAVGGSLFSAGCMLRLYQRATAGTLAEAARSSGRELGMLLPLAAVTVWIGIHPAPILRAAQSAVGRVAVRVSPEYGAAIAQAEAECNESAVPTPPSDAPAGLMAAPPCDTPAAVAVPGPPGR